MCNYAITRNRVIFTFAKLHTISITRYGTSILRYETARRLETSFIFKFAPRRVSVSDTIRYDTARVPFPRKKKKIVEKIGKFVLG